MADEPRPEGAQQQPDEPQPAKPSEAVPPAAEAQPATQPPIPAPAPQAAAAAPKPPAKPAAPAAPKPPPTMAATPWESDLTSSLAEKFGEQITAFSSYLGQSFLVARPASVFPIVDFLKSHHEFDYLVDVTAVDDPKKPDRFELVYILYSFARNERIRLKTRILDGEKPATVVPLHPTANWLEREVFDMFGIEFSGHPDMKRILLPDEWEGYPLRKDYDILKMDQRWVQENLGIESGQ